MRDFGSFIGVDLILFYYVTNYSFSWHRLLRRTLVRSGFCSAYGVCLLCQAPFGTSDTVQTINCKNFKSNHLSNFHPTSLKCATSSKPKLLCNLKLASFV